MRDALFHLERAQATTLQSQIRETLVSAVLAGQLAPGSPVPSTRAMARRLKVSRNTVTLAYQALVTDGFLAARERSGFYVAEDAPSVHFEVPQGERPPAAHPVDWVGRFRVRPTRQDNIHKPVDWRQFPYPFIYGQMDAGLFPIADWRGLRTPGHGHPLAGCLDRGPVRRGRSDADRADPSAHPAPARNRGE